MLWLCVAGERLVDTTQEPPAAEFGEKIMYMTPKNTTNSGPNVDAKFHDGI